MLGFPIPDTNLENQYEKSNCFGSDFFRKALSMDPLNQQQMDKTNPIKTSNSKDIAFWDSGDDEQFSSKDSKQMVKHADINKSTKSKDSQSKAGAWKDWDEL